jgi:formylglycine-generating enzyme required for sulfatase activity
MQGGAGALVLLLTLGGCASSEFAAVNTEPGFYYGFGSGSTEVAAQDAAFLDLVYNTFTETGSIKKDRKARVTLTAEMKAALTPLTPKPFLLEKKSDTAFNAVYRVKYADWTLAETARLAGLQADLGGRFTAVSNDAKATLGARLVEAVRITQALDRHGVPLALRVGAADSALLSDAVVAWAKAQVAGAAFTFKPEGGLIDEGQPVVVTLATGKPLSGVPVTAVWTTDNASAPALNLVTDAKGTITTPYPSDPAFRNVKPVLKVTTKIGTLAPEAAFLAPLDAGLKAEAAYRNAVVQANLKNDEARIEGGTFTIGSVKQDRRAGSKEKPRSVTVKSFFMDTVPVTNAQFRSYLQTNDIPKADWPDFLGDGELSAPTQPVVGVTLAEAQKYAAWASSVLGVKKRLPTEEEYEVAARAGQNTIYPWGDEAPTDGVRANYSGNKKFTSTSPVGSFANGANPLGLLDMVGNVWEWTTSSPDALISADPTFILIKGGSFLDGPGELRISNRRAVDPNETASDLGFRLVREDN